jgi:hypothetical protein
MLEDEIDQEEKRTEHRKVILIAAGIFILLAICAGIYYLWVYKKPPEEAQPIEAPPVAAAEAESLPGTKPEVPALPLVELDKSDDLVRQLASELSSHPRLIQWLQSKELVRRFVAGVDNIANGLSPRPNIEFFMPDGEYQAIERGGLYYANPDGYSRYNPVVDVFISLDSQKCVSLFRGLKPLLQEAYRDLGYPDEDFENTLIKAIIELLKAPVVDGTILLDKRVLSYVMLDPKLENLSEAQKHLLRMGPENVEAIQKKLREIGLAFGAPEGQLPQMRYYTPRAEGF